jgi:hypothetical protein
MQRVRGMHWQKIGIVAETGGASGEGDALRQAVGPGRFDEFDNVAAVLERLAGAPPRLAERALEAVGVAPAT